MRSLLWPDGRPPAAALVRLDDDALRDLELDRVAGWIAEERPDRRAAVADLLTNLPADAATVRWRAEASADLLASPALCDRLQAVARSLRLLAAHRPQAFGRDVPRAARIGARVVELAAYVEAVGLLRAALGGAGAAEGRVAREGAPSFTSAAQGWAAREGAPSFTSAAQGWAAREGAPSFTSAAAPGFPVPAVRSAALLALGADAERAATTGEFRALEAELPRWRRVLDEVRSVTVAINVSPAMEPESAVIVGFGARQAGADEAALSRMLGEDTGARGQVRLFRRQPVDWTGEGRMVADVQALLESVAAPVERALGGFRLVNAQALAHLEDELVLLLGAARLGLRWRAQGLPCCLADMAGALARIPPSSAAEVTAGAAGRAAVTSAAPGETRIEGVFHPVLAAALGRPDELVRNDVAFGAAGRIWVLTGPNRGGKTSYLRALGVAQVLGQCGLPVPAQRASLSMVDRVFTHFPVPEAGRAGQGRLDEEAARASRIFDACTPASLVLLNEVLAGTSAPEAVALAADVLRGFRALGCSVVYATHLHELALRCADVNASLDGPGRVASLTVEVVAGVLDGLTVARPTYRVLPGPPTGASFFASEIARQHGIDLRQLLDRLRARGVLPGPP